MSHQILPAYTYSPATAAFQVNNGTIQMADITNLDRQINIDPTGKVTASDRYRIINNSTLSMDSFILDLPKNAKNVAIKDASGSTLTIASTKKSTGLCRKMPL